MPSRFRRGRDRRRGITVAVAAVVVGGGIGAGVALAAGSGPSDSVTPVADRSVLTTTTTIPPTTTTTAPTPPPTAPPGTIVTNGPRDRRAVALTFDSNLTDPMIQELDPHRRASFANAAAIDQLAQLRVPATPFPA